MSRPYRDACPSCDGLKEKRSKLCQACRRAKVSREKARLCPLCGGPKVERAKRCQRCFQAEIANQTPRNELRRRAYEAFRLLERDDIDPHDALAMVVWPPKRFSKEG